jgi:hypothetical protein
MTETAVPQQDFKKALTRLSFFIIPFHFGSGGFGPGGRFHVSQRVTGAHSLQQEKLENLTGK